MTVEPLPSFDLYEELQVARHASTEVIEAAFRSIVRRLDPGPARPGDDERLRRLTLARDWLVDPDRRRRYDAAIPEAGTDWLARAAGSGTAGVAATRDGDQARPGSSRDPVKPSFGPNAAEVRRFLADLRALDWDGALRLWETRTEAAVAGHAAARRRAEAVASRSRHEAWLMAREAAFVIARGRLGTSTVTVQIAELVADAAGAIALRGLLAHADYELLAAPWVGGWAAGIAADRGLEARAAGSAASGRRVAGLAATVALTSRQIRTRLTAGRAGPTVGLPAAAAVMALVVLVIGIATLGRASLIPGPSTSGSSLATPGAVVVAPPLTLPPPAPAASLETVAPSTAWPFGSSSAAPPTQVVFGATDALTRPPSSRPGSTPTSPPTSVPTPTTAAPTLTPGPSLPPSPIATPSPDPTATATPEPLCLVIDLVGRNTIKAAADWTAAGFSGPVTFDPAVPPHFTIGWQSLAAGTSVACTSGITVRQAAP